MKHYHFFRSGVFSNWYPAPFIYKGHFFTNSEQAYMWEKAMYFNDIETANKILHSPNPAVAKKLGRQVRGFNEQEWEKVRYDIMVAVCLQKFMQNDELRKQLFKYENFVEASPYDTIWGIGMSKDDPNRHDPKNWKGQNLLGKVLDEVRRILMNKK